MRTQSGNFHTGEASRKGFYKYEDKRKATPDPEIMKYIEKSRSMAGVTPDTEVWFCLLTFPTLFTSLEKSTSHSQNHL